MTSSPGPSPASSGEFAARLATVRKAIDKACRRAGRPEGSVILTAATKTQPDSVIDAALATDQRVFGENRVQEAQAHWASRRRNPATTGLELRLIGPLQTNKADEATALFDVIETVDRPRLVEALARSADKTGRCPNLLIQVNTGAEPQKAGVAVADLPQLIAAVRGQGLPLTGLMCIPPVEEAAGPHFALLAKLAARHGLSELSMGMSSDFELAIRFGSTHVRLGTALFGTRSA